MNNASHAYAVSLLKSWFEENQEYFKSHKMVSGLKNSRHGFANVRLETERHLVDISAWDHASCLDIQILEVKSEKSTFPHAGACETRSVFESQLQNVIEWIKNEHQENT